MWIGEFDPVCAREALRTWQSDTTLPGRTPNPDDEDFVSERRSKSRAIFLSHLIFVVLEATADGKCELNGWELLLLSETKASSSGLEVRGGLRDSERHAHGLARLGVALLSPSAGTESDVRTDDVSCIVIGVVLLVHACRFVQ